MASSTVAKSLSVLKVSTLTLPATHGKIAFRDNHIMMYAKNITYILIFLRDLFGLQIHGHVPARHGKIAIKHSCGCQHHDVCKEHYLHMIMTVSTLDLSVGNTKDPSGLRPVRSAVIAQ